MTKIKDVLANLINLVELIDFYKVFVPGFFIHHYACSPLQPTSSIRLYTSSDRRCKCKCRYIHIVSRYTMCIICKCRYIHIVCRYTIYIISTHKRNASVFLNSKPTTNERYLIIKHFYILKPNIP